MRIIARRHGCPFCVTEALLDRTLLAGGRGFDKADLGELHDNVPGGGEDHPLACQIMGSEPTEMAASAIKAIEQRTRSDKAYRMMAYREGTIAQANMSPHVSEHAASFDPAKGINGGIEEEWGAGVSGGGGVSGESGVEEEADTEGELSDGFAHKAFPPHPAAASSLSFQVIDVNLACPVKKIEKKSRGGHWLTDPSGAIKILEAVRDAVPSHIPCTVKLRRSFDDTPEMVQNFHAIFETCSKIGYAWTTVHARTVEQKYMGPSRWDFLRDLRARHPDTIIFGSGDIWNVEDIFLMIAYAGMSGVSVARGCIGNPWIFRQAREMMAGKPPSNPTIAEQRAVLGEHFRLSLACTRRFRQPEQATAMMMRKFAIRFAAHHPDGETVRKKFIAVTSTAQWRAVLDEHYANA